jgi:hypothetical protein
MTSYEVETLRVEIAVNTLQGFSPRHQELMNAITAALALISRLPTFADGAPMVTPCDAWIVPGEWTWTVTDDEWTREKLAIYTRIVGCHTTKTNRRYVISMLDGNGDEYSYFGIGPVYQTEQAARESIK